MGTIAGLLQPHRRVSAADVANPVGLIAADKSEGITTPGTSEMVFAISLTADGAASLTVKLIHYDAQRNQWYDDSTPATTFAAAGNYLLPVKTYGLPVFLKVTAISGTDAIAQIDFTKARTRTLA